MKINRARSRKLLLPAAARASVRGMSALLLALTVFLLAGCQSNGPNVRTDYDRQANFAQYRTFAFQTGRIVSRLGTRDIDNTLVDNRIRDAVVSQLGTKGLQPATQAPDLVVTYLAGAQNKQQIEDLGPAPFAGPYYGGAFFHRGRGWWTPGYDQFTVRDYTQGTLILDFIDARTRQLVWRAYVTGEVDKPDAHAINRAVATALKDYPPKPKG